MNGEFRINEEAGYGHLAGYRLKADSRYDCGNRLRDIDTFEAFALKEKTMDFGLSVAITPHKRSWVMNAKNHRASHGHLVNRDVYLLAAKACR